MTEDRTPILVGAGQVAQRDVEPAAAKDPIALMAEALGRASRDTGIGQDLLAEVDTLAVVNILCWPYANPPWRLANALGMRPRRLLYTTLGGNTPQLLVHHACREVASGRSGVVALAGAEAFATVLAARKAHLDLPWTSAGGDQPESFGDARDGTNAVEAQHGVQIPTQIYPLFENALRAHYGRGLEEHRVELGRLCSRLSAVAAENPYAWFRRPLSAEEISSVGRDNRYIGFPYPKRMNAIIAVDQAAAVLVTSVDEARRRGIDEERWVYLHGAADAHDHWFISERVDYHSSPAIGVVGAHALADAEFDLEEIDLFDLYSCFPVAVEIACDELGIGADDPRPLTVTGGLPYHGGPGNNYSMHAIATMMDRLRGAPGARGLVTALGWYLTKHSVGVYSTEPPVRPWPRPPALDLQSRIDAMAAPVVAVEADGPARIETYTVMHDREGKPMSGIVIGRLDDDRRFVSNLPDDVTVLEALTRREGVGARGRVDSSGGFNVFVPS